MRTCAPGGKRASYGVGRVGSSTSARSFFARHPIDVFVHATSSMPFAVRGTDAKDRPRYRTVTETPRGR